MLRWLGIAMAVLLATPTAPRAQTAEPPTALPDGVELRELDRAGHALWLYLPTRSPATALVVIPPAGGTLLTAPDLTPGDRPEHLPYVEAGFAVVSFRLSGTLTGRVTPKQVEKAIADFALARAGVADARRAIDAALESAPALAGKPIFAAGHSSAANLVLALAADEPRIRAAVAYAPVADAERFIADGSLYEMASRVPGALEVASELSPLRLASRLDTPLLLFHAEDDDVAPIAGTRALARQLESRGHTPRLVIVPSGGHYDAMISEGLRAGVAWLKDQARQP